MSDDRVRITEDEELELRFRVTELEEFQRGTLALAFVAIVVAGIALTLMLRKRVAP